MTCRSGSEVIRQQVKVQGQRIAGKGHGAGKGSPQLQIGQIDQRLLQGCRSRSHIGFGAGDLGLALPKRQQTSHLARTIEGRGERVCRSPRVGRRNQPPDGRLPPGPA